MRTTINKEDFLQKLQSVQPGLTTKDIIEQSSCVVFNKGWMITYNGEVLCKIRSGLDKTFVGVVKCKSLVESLTKLPDDDLDIEITPERMTFLGKGTRKVKLNYNPKVDLELEEVEKPGEWKALHKDFCEAVGVVQQCAEKKAAGNNTDRFMYTCVHLHPKWIEATDDYQYCVWKLKTGLSQPTLVRRNSIKNVTYLGMTEFSETENWLHFKNAKGLILSCRRWLEDWTFTNGEDLVTKAGTPASLPKGLVLSTEIASVFSSENSDDDQVVLELSPNRVKIVGIGLSGEYEESKKAKYAGKSVRFGIPPKLLVEIIEKHSEFILSEQSLRVDGGSWQYGTVLGDVPTNGEVVVVDPPRQEKRKRKESEEE